MHYVVSSLFQTAIDSAISMNDQAVIVDVISILNEICHFLPISDCHRLCYKYE